MHSQPLHVICVLDDCGSSKGLYAKFKTFFKPLFSFSRLNVISESTYQIVP